MFVTYAPQDPADGDRQEWSFNPNRVRSDEAQVLLREFGGTSWDLFIQGVKSNNPLARRVLLWHLMRRAHPMTPFKTTPIFYTGEVTVELDSAELTEMLASIESSSQASLPADKSLMLETLQAEIETAQKREADQGKSQAPPTSSTE